MPLPFVLWGAAAVGAALAGKVIYDAVTDEGSSSSTSSSSSGPSREELERQQLESIYKDFQKEFRKFWQNEDQLLCLRGAAAVNLCEKLPSLVRDNAIPPGEALAILHDIERRKTFQADELLTIKNVALLLSQNFPDAEHMVRAINNVLPTDSGCGVLLSAISALLQTPASLRQGVNSLFLPCGQPGDDDGRPFPPRIAFADNYDLCRDEGRLEELFAAAAADAAEPLDALPEDWTRLTPELVRCWKELQDLAAAYAEGLEPRVVVCGMLKAGKSSLLNSLFDDRTNQHFPTARTRKTLKNKTDVRDGIRFVDTPGLDYAAGDTEEARSAYAGADLLLFVHDGAKELEEIQLVFLQQLQALHPDLGEKMIVVITSKEEAGKALEVLQARISEKVRERCGFSPEIFAVENTSYRSEKEKVRATSGIPELRGAIESRCRDVGARLSQQRAERRARALAALRVALDEVASPIRSARRELENRRDALRATFVQMVNSKKALADGVRA